MIPVPAGAAKNINAAVAAPARECRGIVSVHRDRGADGHYTVTLDNRKCYLTTKQHEDRKCFGFDLGLFLISDYLARAVFDSGSAALIGGMKKTSCPLCLRGKS
jgi:hypothetical protein